MAGPVSFHHETPSTSNILGDTYFGDVSPQKNKFDFVEKLIIPITVSVVAGMVIFALREKGKK